MANQYYYLVSTPNTPSFRISTHNYPKQVCSKRITHFHSVLYLFHKGSLHICLSPQNSPLSPKPIQPTIIIRHPLPFFRTATSFKKSEPSIFRPTQFSDNWTSLFQFNQKIGGININRARFLGLA
jgi:hypothetical protein